MKNIHVSSKHKNSLLRIKINYLIVIYGQWKSELPVQQNCWTLIDLTIVYENYALK